MFLSRLACSALVCTWGVPSLRAQDSLDRGLSAGLLLPGTVRFEAYDKDAKLKPSLLIKAHLDAKVADKLYLGAYFHLAAVSYDDTLSFNGTRISDASPKMLEVGGAIKGRFPLSNGMVMKPGFAVGYRTVIASGPIADHVTHHAMGVNGSLEFQFAQGAAPGLFVEVGMLSQPVGGNKYTDITFSPIPYAVVGWRF